MIASSARMAPGEKRSWHRVCSLAPRLPVLPVLGRVVGDLQPTFPVPGIEQEGDLGWRGRLGRPPRVVQGTGAALRPAQGGREPSPAGARTPQPLPGADN